MLDIPYMVDHIPTHIARRAQARLAAAGIPAELLASPQLGARCLRVDLEARPVVDRLLDELMMLRYSEQELRADLNTELRKLCELYRQQPEIPASAMLYAIADDDLSSDDWRELHRLDCALLY